MLVSTVQRNEYTYMYIHTYTHTCIYIYPVLFELPSHSGHHSAWSRVSCAIGRFSFVRYFIVCCCCLVAKSCCCLVAKSSPTLCDPMDYIAHQALLSMGFPRQEYWCGLPFTSSGNIPDLGIEYCVSRWILYHWASREAQSNNINSVYVSIYNLLMPPTPPFSSLVSMSLFS